MDPDGGRQTPLTTGPVDVLPLIAGDSRSVYYVRFSLPSSPMYAVPIEGGEPTLPFGPASATPAGTRVPAGFWPHSLSPDGTLMAGTYWDLEQGRIRVAIVPVASPGIVRALDVPLAVDFEVSFAWAPDGRAITFVKSTDGAVNLWREPLGGGPATRVTNYASGEDIVNHAWSPDGKWLALVRGSAESHVVVIRDTGRSKQRAILNPLQTDDSSPS